MIIPWPKRVKDRKRRQAEGGAECGTGPAREAGAEAASGVEREPARSPEREPGRVAATLDIYKKLELGVGRDLWRTQAYPELDIPSFTMADGPSGLRYQPAWMPKATLTDSLTATCFPSLAILGSTWSVDLAARMGRAIGEEARRYGVDVVLGPGINIKRSPLGGRNFEYLSEDPLVSGTIAAAYVSALQESGTASCIKHFCANSQEYRRFSSNSELDERTLREIYLRAFEIVVKRARPEMVMSAYPQVNGVYCSDNEEILRTILRDEWGFEGVVVSDWGGTHSRTAAYRAGMDLAMPGGSHHLQAQARRALRVGELEEELVDESVERLIALAKRHEGVVEAASERAFRASLDVDDSHAKLLEHNRGIAYETALAGQVLLKNNGALPLAADSKIALVGGMASNPRIQGAGSSRVNAQRSSSLMGVASGKELPWTYHKGYNENGSTTDYLVNTAKAGVSGTDAVVVCVSQPASFEGEGFDRPTIALSDGVNRLVNALIEEAHAQGIPLIAVVYGGGAVALPWAEEADAILWAGLSGEAGAEATFDLLTGVVSPSGKLAESWPICSGDVPCSETWGGQGGDAHYREGVYVGYRYYSSANVQVAYPFGHGLSYTDFTYSALSVEEVVPDEEHEQGGYKFRLTLRNSGDYAGSEVVQAYVCPRGDAATAIHRPKEQLAAFSRVELDPGEEAQVELVLDPHAFDVWCEGAGWTRVAGEYTIEIGSSSEDIRLTENIQVDGRIVHAPSWQSGSWYEHLEGKPTHKDFVALLGREPKDRSLPRDSFDESDSLADLAKVSRLCAAVARFAERGSLAGLEHLPEDDPSVKMMRESSTGSALFSVVNGSGGKFPEALSKALLAAANRRVKGRTRAH